MVGALMAAPPPQAHPPARAYKRLPPPARAALLTLPLLVFIGVTFIAPLGAMLKRSVHAPVVAETLPQTTALLQNWNGTNTPDEMVFAQLAKELLQARESRELVKVARLMNRVQSGTYGLINGSARKLRSVDSAAPGFQGWKAAFIAMDSRWGEAATWHIVRESGRRYTERYYLNALDLTRTEGAIARQPPERRIYLPLLWRTFLVSLTITFLCLLLGYPIAALIASAPPRRAKQLLLLVLVPFWTSLLVRTTSWIVLLQTQGVLNDLLAVLGLINDGNRLQLIYNMTGTVVAMTHVLLPFMVLPLYSVMRGIPQLHLSAAASLGANGWQTFWRVYWPQSLPGVGAGALLVFILALGYYITPALVGGSSGQLISNQIAYHMQNSLNWELASALGGVLLISVAALYLLYHRYFGIERLRLG